MPLFDGADVSNHQGAAMVDQWGQVAVLGATGGWWKVTEGRSYADPYAARHRDATQAAGLRYRGPYHWLSPTSPVADQLTWFSAHIGDLRPGECIQIDIEDPAGLSDAQVFDAVERWEGRYPGRVLAYLGRWYMPYNPTGKRVESYLIDRLLARYGADMKWWLPWYSNTYPAGMPTIPVMWQYAGGDSGVLVEGVGRVDSNQIIDRDRLELLCGYGAPLEPDVIPVPAWKDPDMPAIFRPTDDYHWPGSPTLAEGDYPSTSPHVFVIEVGGALRHITASEYTVYLNRGVTPVAVTGPQMKEMLDTAGVYAAPTVTASGAPTSFTGTVELHAS
jgi:GH25 family lysozyme M1 (1,4-beta-N-acetylmuramidase)